MHIDNPFDEEGARRVLDLSLHRLQIVGLDAASLLFFQHVLVDFLRELGAVLRITVVKLVREHHALHGLLFEFGHALLEDLSHGPSVFHYTGALAS